MTICKCSVCVYSYIQSFFRSYDSKLEYHGPCRLCEIEERLAELQNLAQKHVEDGSQSSHDVGRDSTLASTIAMLLVLDQRLDAAQEDAADLACATLDTIQFTQTIVEAVMLVLVMLVLAVMLVLIWLIGGVLVFCRCF